MKSGRSRPPLPLAAAGTDVVKDSESLNHGAVDLGEGPVQGLGEVVMTAD